VIILTRELLCTNCAGESSPRLRRIQMKKFLIFTILLGLSLVGRTALAEDTLPYGPGDRWDLAKAACEDEGVLFTNQPDACEDAVINCRTKYLQCLKTNCVNSYEDYYGDTYLMCTDQNISTCDFVGEWEYLTKVKPACSYDPSEGQIKYPEIYKVYKIGLVGGDPQGETPDPIVTPDPIETPDPMVTPDPKTPDTPPDNPSLGIDPADPVDLGTELSSINGAGCAFHGVSENAPLFRSLLFACFGFLPLLMGFRKRK